MNWTSLAAAMSGYLIGSFPTAYLIGRLNGINIFKTGSGNMGANNTYHTLGTAWAAVVWIIDAGKGVLAVLVAQLLAGLAAVNQVTALPEVLGALAVVAGHNWSIWVTLLTGELRGGKGAATAGGTWLMMAPLPVFAATIGLWGLIAGVSGYPALATLLTFLVGSGWMILLAASHQIPAVELVYVIGVLGLIYWRHSENLRALLARRERQLKDQTAKSLMAILGAAVLTILLVSVVTGQLLIPH
jgi:glycerol-3-phosphate acyltransferase PlsY